MNFEIKGVLLERTLAVSQKLKCDPEDVLSEIFRKGLDITEIQSTRSASVSNLNGAAHIDSATELFIRQNWEKMSDSQMGSVIGKPATRVNAMRRSLGLLKKIGASPGSKKRGSATGTLSEEHKAYIREHIGDSNMVLATKLRISPVPVSLLREQMATEYIPDHYLEESDGDLCKRFNLTIAKIARIRRKLNCQRIQGSGLRQNNPNKKVSPHDLGTKEEILFALVEGGKKITDIIREKKLTISRERARQLLLEHHNLVVRKLAVKPAWYFRRSNPSISEKMIESLTTKEGIEKFLAEAGSAQALANQLKMSPRQIRKVCDLLFVDQRLLKAHGEMISFPCTYCGNPVYRPKSEQERERNKKQHFCNKTCQGKFLGENNGGTGGKSAKSKKV